MVFSLLLEAEGIPAVFNLFSLFCISLPFPDISTPTRGIQILLRGSKLGRILSTPRAFGWEFVYEFVPVLAVNKSMDGWRCAISGQVA